MKPILEGELSIDGVKYNLRYELCTRGTCSLDSVELIDVPKHTEVKCSDTCEGNCKCTLFRLQVTAEPPAAFDPKNAKWERQAKTDTQVKYDGHYVYRCFCLK